MTNQKPRPVNIALSITAIIAVMLLFGCVQRPENDLAQENSELEMKKIIEETTEKTNEKSSEIEKNENINSFGAKPQTKTETEQLSQFDPKSFGNPNPRSVQSHPEECCNHPYYHYIVSASSSDGLSWQEDDILIRDHSSVPDYAILDDGTQMIYFVDGVYDTLGCIESKDGKTFAESECRIYNFTKEKVWDPNVVSIGNGTYRLFFFSPEFEPSIGQPNSFDQPKNRIFSAISKNGKDWLMEPGIRYEDISITDPSVIKRDDGTWHMFVSHGNTIIQAESSDGLTFKRLQEIKTIGGVPDVTSINGKYYLFTCADGISYANSNDLISWSGLENAIKPWNGGVICDPTVEKTKEGYKMYLKRMGMNKK